MKKGINKWDCRWCTLFFVEMKCRSHKPLSWNVAKVISDASGNQLHCLCKHFEMFLVLLLQPTVITIFLKICLYQLALNLFCACLACSTCLPHSIQVTWKCDLYCIYVCVCECEWVGTRLHQCLYCRRCQHYLIHRQCIKMRKLIHRDMQCAMFFSGGYCVGSAVSRVKIWAPAILTTQNDCTPNKKLRKCILKLLTKSETISIRRRICRNPCRRFTSYWKRCVNHRTKRSAP